MTSADLSIAEMLAAVAGETNPQVAEHALAWRRLLSIVIASADAIGRHADALSRAWPPQRSDVARLFLDHVEAVRSPLGGSAADAAGTNASALAAIAAAARQAHEQLQ